MSSHLKTFSNKGCKIAAQKKNSFWANFANNQEVIQQGSGSGNCNLRVERRTIQKGSGGYTTKIRRFYNKDQEVMFSDAIIEPLQKTLAYKGCKITAKNSLSYLGQIQWYLGHNLEQTESYSGQIKWYLGHIKGYLGHIQWWLGKSSSV